MSRDKSVPSITFGPDRIVRMKELRLLLGEPSRATIWRWTKKGLLPLPVAIGPHLRGWRQSEIMSWIASRQPAANRQDSSD